MEPSGTCPFCNAPLDTDNHTQFTCGTSRDVGGTVQCSSRAAISNLRSRLDAARQEADKIVEALESIAAEQCILERNLHIQHNKEPSPCTIEEVLGALEDLLCYAECNECHHEETRRVGFMWTQCTACCQQWADDRGGFQPYREPESITQARTILQKMRGVTWIK